MRQVQCKLPLNAYDNDLLMSLLSAIRSLYFGRRLGFVVLGNQIVKLDAASTKDVQRASKRQVHLAVGQAVDQGEVTEFLGSSRVRAWNGNPFPETFA